MAEKITRNAYKLFKRVIELSEAKTWEGAKKEWKQIEITQVNEEEDYGSCTCGHYPIKEMIQLFNSKNRNEIIVGNCCINRFFGNKEYNKIFSGLKKGKVNKAMIKDCFQKEIINEWERDFMNNVWRKKKLSIKQRKVRDKITPKILANYKKN